MWGLFNRTKKKTTIELLKENNWVEVRDCLFQKHHYQLDISDQHRQWNITDMKSGAMICGDLSSLEDGLEFVERYV